LKKMRSPPLKAVKQGRIQWNFFAPGAITYIETGKYGVLYEKDVDVYWGVVFGFGRGMRFGAGHGSQHAALAE
jgi:hypothetical protein